jgi:hypothetical protein
MEAAKSRTSFLSCGDNGDNFFSRIDEFYFWFQPALFVQFNDRAISFLCEIERLHIQNAVFA